jgi:FkbM family methyltransferase
LGKQASQRRVRPKERAQEKRKRRRGIGMSILQLPEDPILVELSDFSMYVDPEDDTVSNRIRTNKVWEPESTQVVKENLLEGETFIDVGAHIGYYSMLASKIVGPKGRVIAFEPSPRNFSYLVANITLNRATNVIPLNLPLWETERQVFRHPHNSKNTGDTQIRLAGPYPMTSSYLDALFEPNSVDFLKTDCQGSDYWILKGGKTLILDSPRIKILTEFDQGQWTDYNEQDYDRLLAELNLKVALEIQEERQRFVHH